MSFEQLFTPRAVAVIGSTSPGKLGAVLIKQMLDGGYEGDLLSVNPKAQGVHGVLGYVSVQSFGQPVDLAVIASPADTVVSVLEDCGKAGVKAAVVITAGFKEVGNQAGEDAILAMARKYGIRMIGPNCAGMCNTKHKLFPTLEVLPPCGEVALVSQSGALAGVVLAWAAQQGLGISKFVNFGNGSDWGAVDFLNYLKDDPDTKVVAVYIESVRDGRAFMDALAACSAVKPVVVIKSGRTSAGKRATASHTGSMAGADAVYDTAIQQAGAIRVKTVEEMLDVCNGFVALPTLSGKRMIIVTNSGGPGVLGADHAEESGMQINEPSESIKEQLRTFLPAHCSLRNPIDLTVEGNRSGYQKTLQIVAPEYDAAIAMNICPPYLDADELAWGVIDAAKQSGMPIVANFLPEQVVSSSVKILKENGIPNFSSGEKAASVLAAVSSFYHRQDERSQFDPIKWADTRYHQEPLPGQGAMLEPQAMTWLSQNGIPVPAFHFCTDVESTVAACESLGYPVVMKVVSPQIIHKSDVGGVMVNIRHEVQAKSAFEQIAQNAAGKDFRGVVIYPMIHALQEVLVGLTMDPQFGPVIAFGLGGIYTEVWRDIVLRVGPLSRTDAMEMIHSIRGSKLLSGYRGQPASDLEALAALLVNFSQLPFRYANLAEIDLNPVFMLEKGLLVGDVRVIQTS
jgi:acetyltransferase